MEGGERKRRERTRGRREGRKRGAEDDMLQDARIAERNGRDSTAATDRAAAEPSAGPSSSYDHGRVEKYN